MSRERFIIRHLLDAATSRRLLPALRLKLVPDAEAGPGGACTVTTLYFDAAERASASHEPRRALRLRLLESSARATRCLLETTHRVGLRIREQRLALPLPPSSRALAVPASGPTGATDLEREARDLMLEHDLRPACLVRQERLAFVDPADPSLSITIDSAVAYRTHDLHLQPNDRAFARPLLAEGMALLVIRTPRAVPHWLSLALGRDSPLVPSPYILALQHAASQRPAHREA
jgi:hypothetical protein